MLYRNSRTLRVRFIQILLWTVTLGSLALLSADSLGAAPGSWVMGAILAPIFGLCALGIEFYLRCYVTALEECPEGLRMETLSTLGRTQRIIPWSDVKLGGDHRDIAVYPGAPIVNNSYTFLRIKGRRMPLIIDTTEDAVDATRLRNRHVGPEQ